MKKLQSLKGSKKKERGEFLGNRNDLQSIVQKDRKKALENKENYEKAMQDIPTEKYAVMINGKRVIKERRLDIKPNTYN